MTLPPLNPDNRKYKYEIGQKVTMKGSDEPIYTIVSKSIQNNHPTYSISSNEGTSLVKENQIKTYKKSRELLGSLPSMAPSVPIPKYKVGDTLIIERSTLIIMFPSIRLESSLKPKLKAIIKTITSTNVTIEVNLKDILIKSVYDILPEGTDKIIIKTESKSDFETSLSSGDVKIQSSNMFYAIAILGLLFLINN